MGKFIMPFLVVSAAYIAAYMLSIYALLPFQSAYTPQLASYASLLFLPHGVRVLAAWLYGWKAIPLVAPAALLTHWMNLGADGFTLDGMVGVFWTLSQIGMDFRLTADKRANWRDIMLAGSIASVINTFGMGWAFDHNFATLGGYFIGDISGMFACMFVLMFVFSAQRRSVA
jgi:hypothetical protein